MKLIWFLCVASFILNISRTETTNAKVHVITMEGMRFDPKVLEINVGETVRWINLSNSTHNVIAYDKSFQSKMLPTKGGVFEHTFRITCESVYFCQPHKLMGMKGKIIVK